NKFILLKDGKVFSFGNSDIMNKQNIRNVFGVDVEIIDFNGRKMVGVY
ncbi:iron ABC transporter ATP-binding protein, partial [Salmonella enterica]|nr:iron ABC transporter ATP-binding protein [Salmonella enterica]